MPDYLYLILVNQKKSAINRMREISEICTLKLLVFILLLVLALPWNKLERWPFVILFFKSRTVCVLYNYSTNTLSVNMKNTYIKCYKVISGFLGKLFEKVAQRCIA